MGEVKAALLHEYEGEHGTLIMVDEDYRIHTMTSEDGHLREIMDLAGTKLPNFASRRLVGEPGHMRVVHKGEGLGKYYDQAEVIVLFDQYSDPTTVAKSAKVKASGKGLLEQIEDRLSDPEDSLYECEEVATLMEIIEHVEEDNNRLRHMLRA